MGSLKDWANKHTKYVKLVNEEPLVCKLISWKPFVDHDNEDTDKIRYTLEVGGDEKLLESQSIGLAGAISKVSLNDWIKIIRTGKGRNTRYEVEKVAKP